MANSGREVRTFADLEALSQAAAESIVAIARESVQARGRFSIALAGGNTPKRTYELLGERHRDAIDWSRWQVLFGDERFVPKDDKRSNYRMARDALLAGTPIPVDNVHPIPTDTPTVGDAADAYDRTLRHVLADATQLAAIDLVLLGVGPDGHTASLFPGSPVLREVFRTVAAVHVTAAQIPQRITLTFPVLNAAARVIFLVAGAEKAKIVKSVLSDQAMVPAGMIRPTEGELIWLADRAAAALHPIGGAR